MRFDTAVLTHRRPRPTVDLTIQSLIAAGWTDGFLLYDGSPPAGERPSPKWCTNAYRAVFATWLLKESDAEGLLIFEDDVVAIPGMRDYLDSFAWPQYAALMSLDCHDSRPDNGRWWGWGWVSGDAGLTGERSRAGLYTRRAAERLVESLDPDMRDCWGWGHVGIAAQVRALAQRDGLCIWHHVPSLVGHIDPLREVPQ